MAHALPGHGYKPVRQHGEILVHFDTFVGLVIDRLDVKATFECMEDLV